MEHEFHLLADFQDDISVFLILNGVVGSVDLILECDVFCFGFEIGLILGYSLFCYIQGEYRSNRECVSELF